MAKSKKKAAGKQRAKGGKSAAPDGERTETLAAAKGGGAKPGGAKRQTAAMRACLTLPPTRIRNKLKVASGGKRRVGVGAGVYLAAVMEYLAAEVLELAGNAARDNKKRRVTPRHILLALRNDMELDELTGAVTIPQGGVLPHVHRSLLPKASLKGAAARD